ncbi:MAG: hypothetical protein H6737_04035 [Alphaproteobacteria bacterium]|nr:hypothetical protein [Alphaproteobacteria bacterium]
MHDDTDAFAPPSEAPARTPLAGTVLLAWMMSGGVIGLAAGLTSQVLGFDPRVATPLGIGSIAAMTIAGGIALQVERARAKHRPAVLSERGRHERPLHAALFAIPMAFAVPALVALVVVGSVATSSLVPAVLFGTGGFGLGWAARRVASSHTLTAALEALETGDTARARELLQRLEVGWMSTRAGRTTARLNLGMLALSEGDLDGAARYYETIASEPGRSFARAGLALVRVLQDRLEEAEAAVLDAMGAEQAHGVQGQIDTVRLLLVLRKDGDQAARAMGEQLLTMEAGELFRGVLALLRRRAGDAAGAGELADAHTLQALEESGWAGVIPEISELLEPLPA